MLSIENLTTDIKITGAKDTNGMYNIIGYVDIKDGENVAFHANLTPITIDLEGKTTIEEQQAYLQELNDQAQAEADAILASECAVKCCDQYIFLKNSGLY